MSKFSFKKVTVITSLVYQLVNFLIDLYKTFREKMYEEDSDDEKKDPKRVSE